ncbi:MAG: hypothetical protein II929_08425, partial [Succinivibrio sp.]|nr:hypothetical protein [Succinivibrio sp.]
SLVKKIEIMKKIEEENARQKEILLNSEDVNLEAFDKTLDIKGEYIDELEKLDDGFQSLFDRVKQEVGDNKKTYADQIKRMQELIHEIMDRSASIEAAEHRNKKLAENYFSSEREKMATGKRSSAAAFNYYTTMNNFKDIPPQFLDTKN